MIFEFNDAAVLRRVLSAGVLASSTLRSSVCYARDDEGHILIETTARLSQSTVSSVTELGAVKSKKAVLADSIQASCWFECCPFEPQPAQPLSPETTVLVEVAAGDFRHFCVELMRLGCDKAQHQHLGDRVIFIVTGLPYYLLLGCKDRAYIGHTHNVWSAVGCTHPFVNRLSASDDKVLLIGPDRPWTLMTKPTTVPLFQVTEFAINPGPVEFVDAPLPKHLETTIGLTHRDPPAPADLWIIDAENPVDALNDMAANSDDQTLARLQFTVVDSGESVAVLLRPGEVRAERPVLPACFKPYCQYLKLPGLYVPCDRAVYPPLRRDVVRNLLCGPDGSLTWLHPEEGRSFTDKRVSSVKFQSLLSYVEYARGENSDVPHWEASDIFGFEKFTCNEKEESDKTSKEPAKQTSGGTRRYRGPASGETAKAAAWVPPAPTVPTYVPLTPTQQQLRLKELETAFIAVTGTLDTPERVTMLYEMGHLNTETGDHSAAGLCWLSAIWSDPGVGRDHLWEWFRIEALASRAREKLDSKVSSWNRDITAKQSHLTDTALTDLLSSPANTRSLCAYLCWAEKAAVPAQLTARLREICLFLEANERQIPVRAAWLAWSALSRMTGDVLLLARARDRALRLLFEKGNRDVSELPVFLRVLSSKDGCKLLGRDEWLSRLIDKGLKWSESLRSTLPAEAVGTTLCCIKALFSCAAAYMGCTVIRTRLNEEVISDLRPALAKLVDKVGASEKQHATQAMTFIVESLLFRSAVIADGRPTEPLPVERITYLNEKMDKMQRYYVDRLRQHSRLMSPGERVDAFTEWGANADALLVAINEAVKNPDSSKVESALLLLLRKQQELGGAGWRLVLEYCFDTAPKLSDDFVSVVMQSLAAYWDTGVAGVTEQAKLLEKALFAAAHYDRRDDVAVLSDRFRVLLSSKALVQSADVIENLASESLRGLRRLGMGDRVNGLLETMQTVLLGGKKPSSLTIASEDSNNASILCSLLHVAGGYLYFGRNDAAAPLLSAGRAALFSNWPPSMDKNKAAMAAVYARTVGNLNPDEAAAGLEEVFSLKNLCDTLTTSRYYSLLQLQVVEAVVLSIAGSDGQNSTGNRRFADDSEFILRRRIHADYRSASGS